MTEKAVLLEGTYQDDYHPQTSHTARLTRWRKVSGPGPVVIDDHYAKSTQATFSQPGRYVLQLSASDGAHQVHDTLMVTVREGGKL